MKEIIGCLSGTTVTLVCSQAVSKRRAFIMNR